MKDSSSKQKSGMRPLQSEDPPSPTGWPWPLNGVQGWFEGLLGRVSKAVWPFFEKIWGWIWAKIQWVRDRVNDAAKWITEHIWDPLRGWFTGAVAHLKAVFKEAWDWTWERVKGLAEPWRTLVRLLLLPPATVYFLLKPAIDGIWAVMPAPLKQFVEFLKTLTAKLWEGFLGFLRDPVGTLKRGWDFVAGKVGEIGAAVRHGFEGAFAWIKAHVADPIMAGIATIGGWIADVLKGVVEALGAGLRAFADWFLKHLTWIGQMLVGAAHALITTLMDALAGLVKRFIDMLTAAFTPGSPHPELEQAILVMAETVQKQTLETIKEAYKSPASPEAIVIAAYKVVTVMMVAQVGSDAAGTAASTEVLGTSVDIKGIIRSAVRTLGFAAVVGAIVRMPVDVGMLAPLRYWYNSVFANRIPGDGELTRLATERIIDMPTFYTNMRMQGLNEFWSEKMLASVWRVPGYSELREMFWRGKIDSATLVGGLRVTGIREDFIPAYEDLLRRIPSPGELLNMAGLDVIPLEEFHSCMPMHGFYSPWPERLWAGHWTPLSRGEVRSACHRGLIDDGELAKYMGLHNLKPEPRPGIRTSDAELAQQLVWDLPSWRDVRFMFRWGEIGVEGVEDLRVKGGLHPKWGPAVARAVAKQEFAEEIARIRDNIKADFRDGFINEATARADLAELDFLPERVEFHIRDALADQERQHKKALLDYYRDCWLADIPTEPPFEDAVHEILVVPKAADLFIERAYVRKVGRKKAK